MSLLKLLCHILFPILFGLFMKNSSPLAPPLAKAWGVCTPPQPQGIHPCSSVNYDHMQSIDTITDFSFCKITYLIVS